MNKSILTNNHNRRSIGLFEAENNINLTNHNININKTTHKGIVSRK